MHLAARRCVQALTACTWQTVPLLHCPCPQVLDAVPWVSPRPLYLLATEQREQPSVSAAAAAAVRFGADAAPGQTYTLRTRVAKDDMEDELSRLVLRRRAADGTPLIRCRCAWVQGVWVAELPHGFGLSLLKQRIRCLWLLADGGCVWLVQCIHPCLHSCVQ